jgi:Siphovirus Gp157
MTTLRDLTTNRLALQHKLEGGNFDDATISDTLEGDSQLINAKIEDYCYVIRNMESPIADIDAEIERLQARKKSYVSKVEHIKNWLFVNMQACGITKMESSIFTAVIQNNPPSVHIDDLAAIPVKFMRVKPPPPAEPDKIAIKEALKAGKEVAGCHLESTQKLMIK